MDQGGLMTTTKPFAELTLHEIMKLNPKAIDILNAHMLDTCCGEHRTLAQNVSEANASLETVVAELEAL
jgi:iron-sulfur cluster repair protein YtfE (RIC family)